MAKLAIPLIREDSETLDAAKVAITPAASCPPSPQAIGKLERART
jgi:hypothetical protein